MPPKALLVANTSWYLYNFRGALARALREEGFEVVCVAPDAEYGSRLRTEGFRLLVIPMDRGGTNPFVDLRTIGYLVALYRRERPSVVHHMTVKCVLYGSIAAIACGVPAILNAVTGLGHVFISGGRRASLMKPIVRTLYRFALGATRSRTIFQNDDDLNAFTEAGLVSRDRAALIRGSGIDTNRFVPRPDNDAPGEATVLMVGRLIAEKGVLEFVEAGRVLRRRGVQARFLLAGAPDPGNPSAISASRLASWRREGHLTLLGHVDRIEDVLAQATIVVLPSHREGLPRTLVEAAAMEKAIVATDVPGCRDAVQNEVNGILVPVRDPVSLAAAIERLLCEPETRLRMGRAGRALVLREFDERKVVAETLALYKELLRLSRQP